MQEFILASPHGRELKLIRKPAIMGIINLTPDSFFKGSRILDIEKAVQKALQMVQDGASLIDFGGESTRPGAKPVPVEEEIRRTIRVIKEFRKHNEDVFVSIDTYKAEVARLAIEAGADMVNDISGLTFDPDMPFVVKKYNVPFVINHIKGTPLNMQKAPFYTDVVEEIYRFFESRITALEGLGISRDKMVLDPGIGFGKRQEDNIELLKNISRFKMLNLPIMVGHSRKSLIGYLCFNLPPEERLEGTLAITAFLTLQGIQIIRVHDVLPNYRVIETMFNFLNSRYL